MRINLNRVTILSGLVLAATFGGINSAHAALALTAQGVTDGFTLTTFLSGYSNAAEYGPLSVGILPDGNAVTGSDFNVGATNLSGSSADSILVFPDVDGQTLHTALIQTSYTPTPFNGNPQYAITTAGGQVYGAQVGNAGGAPGYELFNNNGTRTALTFTNVANPSQTASDFLGIWGAPNGHIIASAQQGLIDLNPATGTFRIIASNPGVDGVSVSPDGLHLFAEAGGNILEYNIATGVLEHVFSGNGHSPDGTGVITGGLFNGDIVVNDNDGTVGLIDPTTGIEILIASGGTRGDFVSPDTSNGTLFLSQLEDIDRLSCGPGCSIGSTSGGGSVPEPASLVLFGAGFVAFGLLRRRKTV